VSERWREQLCNFIMIFNDIIDLTAAAAAAVSVMYDLLEFVGVSEKTLSLACARLNASAFQKQSHLYEQLTYAVAQVCF